ncbi:hypothetical protein FK535_22450 [Mycolicibacterium sp. 018/SC-01/001]|uniref:NACHT domain-containing protein n=1 Tax=Mycolicibacterium sp. 018/SC-01/001 TaxID=2592069 RepID=UPI00118029E9|nr:hypothetical protein [Mycolicibacterium sp. 018/SC-01/001]TRW79286.1 hypothetical protein FK535_22450 [Mycolicibacterium sp. 018/SC-01/001]
MTGLESTALGIGQAALKAVAMAAAKSLAGRATFRWAVWWRVRGRTEFPCPWRAYVKWLKTISGDELARPMEEIQGPLAIRLNHALSAASRDWGAADDHLSRALQLVEMTYPAIAAAMGGSDQVALTQMWAQERSVSVRDRLLQLVGPTAALSPYDLAAVLHRRSRARRTVRLQAFDVDESAMSPYFAEIEVPDVSVERVIVLMGDFGSGKSETAEAWHRATIEIFVESNGPIPLWLSARQLLGHALEDAVNRHLPPAWRGGRGASIVVDGLDEATPATAQAVLEDARILAQTHANTRIILTARPGILSSSPSEEVAAKLLSEEKSIQLVELAGGRSRSTWSWTASMRATVRRPFFALAAGFMLGRDEAPRGEADLIRALVENALVIAPERSAVTSAETRSALQRLAINLTRTGGDCLSFIDRQIARSSRLTADGPDGAVLFSLPIFQHYFAAQAILDDNVSATEVVTDAASFNRWRWAAAVAALSAPDAQAVDDLLASLVAGNPGAAAWIIKAAFSGQRDWRTETDQLDANTSGPRLLRSLRTWSDALGPLARGVLPYPLVQGPVELGVMASGHLINVAFSTSSPAEDSVKNVPPGVHPLGGTASGWIPWFFGAPPGGTAWPWTMARKQIAKATAGKLSTDPSIGAPDGIWAQERRFDLARRLLGRGSLFHRPLPASEVRVQAEAVFNSIGRERDARITLPSGQAIYFGAELADLISWLDENSAEEVPSHLPAEDIANPKGGFAWHFFSAPRLMEFEVEVYGRACEAYDEALAHSFARLGWSMPSSSFAPFGVVLEISFGDSDRLGGIPGLTAMRVPMELMCSIADFGSEAARSASGRAVARQATRDPAADREHYSATLEAVRAWLAEQNREPISGLGWMNGGADDMSNVRPASSVAAGWLWSDLQSIGLGDSIRRELR